MISAAVAPGGSVVTTAETTVVTSPVVPGNQPVGSPQKIAIKGYVNITAGTGTTAITVRVRAGVGTGGTVLSAAAPDTLAAGNSEAIPIGAVDSASFPAGFQYTITVQQTGATGNGTIVDGFIEVDGINQQQIT